MNFISSRVLLFLICIFNFTSILAYNKYESIAYNFDLKDVKDSVLNVEVSLQGKFQQKVVMSLPSKWASAYYIPQITNIKIHTPHCKMHITDGKDGLQAIIIPEKINKKIILSYQIHQKIDNPADVHEAIIRKDIVHSPGYGLFATPEDLNNNQKVNISVNWNDIPNKWHSLSSFNRDHNTQLYITVGDLLHAFYLIGNVRLYNIGNKTSPIFLSLYGKFDLSDRQIKSDLSKIIRSQKKFFNDYDFPYYAISLIEGNKPNYIGGTRLINSFTAYIPNNIPKINYNILFAHENLHNWIGGKIRNNKDEELNYWWTEGFTDYYSRLIAFRYKSITNHEFVREINELLRNYYLSPVNREPNTRIQKDFWDNYDVEKLPYYRGFVFAIFLNNLIQKENTGKSLDNIMYDLFKDSKDQIFSSKLFQNLARKYIPQKIDLAMKNYIENGDIISLVDVSLPLEKLTMGRYYLGFNYDAMMQTHKVKDIDIRSNGYMAGLRNGQKVIEFSLPKGLQNSNQIVTIKTTDGIFKFKPEHYDKVDVYQIKENLNSKERKQFNKFFRKHPLSLLRNES